VAVAVAEDPAETERAPVRLNEVLREEDDVIARNDTAFIGWEAWFTSMLAKRCRGDVIWLQSSDGFDVEIKAKLDGMLAVCASGRCGLCQKDSKMKGFPIETLKNPKASSQRTQRNSNCFGI
jgi:hypothetical protein